MILHKNIVGITHIGLVSSQYSDTIIQASLMHDNLFLNIHYKILRLTSHSALIAGSILVAWIILAIRVVHAAH